MLWSYFIFNYGSCRISARNSFSTKIPPDNKSSAGQNHFASRLGRSGWSCVPFVVPSGEKALYFWESAVKIVQPKSQEGHFWACHPPAPTLRTKLGNEEPQLLRGCLPTAVIMHSGDENTGDVASPFQLGLGRMGTGCGTHLRNGSLEMAVEEV